MNAAVAPALDAPATPEVHAKVSASPSGSLEPRPSTISSTPVTPAPAPPITARGARLAVASSTRIDRVAVSLPPRPSVTVNETVKVPAPAKVWEALSPAAVPPPSKLHRNASGSPSGSLDAPPFRSRGCPAATRSADRMTAEGLALVCAGGAIAIAWVVVATPPRPSLAVRVTMNGPGEAKVFATLTPPPDVPSPNAHTNESASPSGSPEPVLAKITGWPVVPADGATMTAVGAWFCAGGGAMVTVRVAVPSPPRPSLTVRVTT